MMRAADAYKLNEIQSGVVRRASTTWPAVVVALLVLLAAGTTYRLLANHLERAPGTTPIARGTLAHLPLEFGPWHGHDQAVDGAVIRAADVDDYVYRSYVRQTDQQTVGLWIAFGVRARDLMPHRPEVCYPGAGWTLRERRTVTVPLPEGGELQTRLLTFAPGGLGAEDLTVLNYYIVDDETCEDVSLLRSKAWRGQAAIRYMAQVQITCDRNPVLANTTPEEAVRAFAAETFAQVRTLLDQAVGSAPAQPAGS